MHLTRRASRTVLAATIALGVVAVPSAALTAPTFVGAATQAPAAMPAAVGTADGALVLTTSSTTGTVTWNGQTQQFTGGQQCAISPVGAPPELLRIGGSVGDGSSTALAGFRDGAIGVYEPAAGSSDPNNASQCARVDAGSFTDTESLTLVLGSAVASEGTRLIATSATVDLVAVSRTLRVTATLLDELGQPILDSDDEEVTVDLGSPWRGLKPGSKVPTEDIAVMSGFGGLKLTAVEGSFSLRGATFGVATGILDCGDSDEVLATGADPYMKVTRLTNADGSTCIRIPYTLSNGDQTARFLKPLDQQTTAQFVLDFIWTVSPANTGSVSSALLPETTIDYEVGDPALPPVTLRWCPDVLTDGGGDFTGIDNVLGNPAAADQVPNAVLPGKQFTCIVSQNATVSNGSPDYVTVEQRVYLLGDAAYRFR